MDTPQNIIKSYLSVRSEGVSEHPDVADQPEFAKRVEKVLEKRRERRTPKGKAIAQAVEFHNKSVIKKKVEESSCGCDAEETPPIKKDKKDKVMDAREIPTKVNLIKTKLRLMGLRMSYEPEEEMVEETKSGDKSLRDWISKSSGTDPKTGRKVPGWVQLGGPFAGAPCARQPGQTSTPKCGSSKMAANLSDKEEDKAFERKNRKDPNQPQKKNASSPTNVRTEEIELQEKKGKKDACYSKVKSRYSIWPSAYASLALSKCRKVGAANWGTKSEETIAEKEMTSTEIKAEKKLKSKYDPSGMKASMIKQYGEEKGKQIYFATIRKKAMEEVLENEDSLLDEAKRSGEERRAANAGKKGYNKEGKPVPKVSTTHVIHDVDDNLADQRHPDVAKIDLMRKIKEEWEKEKSLTPGEFAHHELKPGRKYKFDAFGKTKLFKDTTKKTTVSKMGDSPKRPASKSVVTARGGHKFGSNKPSTPMDDPGSFAKDLRGRIGVRGLKRKDIHFTGGMNKGPNKGLSGPEKKANVVTQIVSPSDKKIITTDDHLGNTRAMAAAASKAAPQAKVKAYQSRPATRKPKGKGKVGDIVPSRVGKEDKPGDINIGIRANSEAPKTTEQTQRARKKARRNMGEEMTYYKDDFELSYDHMLEQLILEGLAEDYDSAMELTESFDDELLGDLMREAITAIASPAPEPNRPEKKGPRKLSPVYGKNKKLPPKKEYKEDFTPYEFWMNIIETQQPEIVEEVEEEEIEEIVEEGPTTSYDYWKKYIEENANFSDN